MLRFLQGREMDVKKACTMFQKFLKFREEYNVNEIRDNIVKHGMVSSFGTVAVPSNIMLCPLNVF